MLYKDENPFSSTNEKDCNLIQRNRKLLFMNSDNKKDLKIVPSLSDINTFKEICEYFLTKWFESDINELMCIIGDILNVSNLVECDEFYNEIINSEVIETLILIINLNEAESSVLKFLERGQTLLVRSFELLFSFTCYSDKIISDLIDYDLVNIVTSNYFNYCEEVKVKLFPLLANVYSNKTKTKQFSNIQELLVILNDELKSTRIDSILYDISMLISNISRNIDNLPDESKSYLYKNIFLYIFKDNFISQCLQYGLCGLFYFYFSNINYLTDFEFIKNIILRIFDTNDKFLIYYAIQILKLCYLNLPNDEMIILHNMINFYKFHNFICNTENISSSITCFECVARRGRCYIHSLINCEIYLLITEIYNDVDFDVKNSINNFISITFEECDQQQAELLMNQGIFYFLKDSLLSINEKYLKHALCGIINLLSMNFPIFDSELTEILRQIEITNNKTQIIFDKLKLMFLNS